MPSVFIDVGMSLDGFIAGPNGRPGNPVGDGGTRIHEWVFPLAVLAERAGGSGGERGPDDDLVRAVFDRTGAYVMGRRTFDEGEVGWPEHAPFRAPVFVVTRHARESWVRPGGTVFHFVTEGFEEALRCAREAAGGKDVRVQGGASVIQQALRAGVVDELTVHLAPVLLGKGVLLLANLPAETFRLTPVEAHASARVTHLTWRVER
jgi:dihydrofolate reductase